MKNPSTYHDVFWGIDESIAEALSQSTAKERALLDLRQEFLKRVSKGNPMRLPIKRDEDGRPEGMIDPLRNGELVLDSYAIPFKDRALPEQHLVWLREQIKQRGLSKVLDW